MADYYDPKADWSLIPPHMREGVTAYVMHGRPTGDFLRAMFSNDFMEAAGRADTENLAALSGWAQFIYCSTPTGCWGSPKAYADWIKAGGLNGQLAKEAKLA